MKRASTPLFLRWPPPEQAPAADAPRAWGRPVAGLLCVALAVALAYVNLRRTPIGIVRA